MESGTPIFEVLFVETNERIQGGTVVELRIRCQAHIAVKRPLAGFQLRTRSGQMLVGEYIRISPFLSVLVIALTSTSYFKCPSYRLEPKPLW